MKYNKIFTSWWFYVIFVIYFILEIVTALRIYGDLFLIEHALGILIGSFIGVSFLASIFWLIIKFFSWIIKKFKKR